MKYFKTALLTTIMACLIVGNSFSAAFADCAPSEEFIDQVYDQSFAVAMSCWLSDYPLYSNLDDPLQLWDIAGWYAARLYRGSGYDLVSDDLIADFINSLPHDGGVPEVPQDWLEYDVVRLLTGPDAIYYDFVQHKTEIDAMLGIDTEVSITAASELQVKAETIFHAINGEVRKTAFLLSFSPNTDSGNPFPYRLISVNRVSQEPELIGDLTFTWEDLLEANRLSTVFRWCNAVKITYPSLDPDICNWVLSYHGNPALLYWNGSSYSGQYLFCHFDYEVQNDGKLRASISERDDRAGSADALENFILDTFTQPIEIRFNRIEDDLIWTDVTYDNDVHKQIAFDYGTLRIQEIQYHYSDNLSPSVTRFEYYSECPEFEFLNSWDNGLRSVTLHWEDYRSGERTFWDEFRRIPLDWEYLPMEGRTDEFTVYMDRGYTRPYAYPGDGIDYEIWLTTAKG